MPAHSRMKLDTKRCVQCVVILTTPAKPFCFDYLRLRPRVELDSPWWAQMPCKLWHQGLSVSYYLSLELKRPTLKLWMPNATSWSWRISPLLPSQLPATRNTRLFTTWNLLQCLQAQKSTWGSRDHRKVKLCLTQCAVCMDTPLPQSEGEVLRIIQFWRGDLKSLDQRSWILKFSRI
jgi:hypothetical protein